MKRIISIALVILMITALVGCGSKKRKPITLTLSSEDSTKILAAAGIHLPDASIAPGAGSTVKWFSWWDPFQNYSEDEIVNTGFYTFREKYGGSIQYVETTYQEHHNDLATKVLSDDVPDAMPGGTNSMAFFPQNCLKEMIQPCDPWIDFTDPLWEPMKDLADLFAIGDKHYQICIKTVPSNVCAYNKRIIDDYGYEDPAELYYNDEWTWDKFYEMCLDFSDIDADRFALDGYAYVSMFIESTGEHFVMHTAEDGYWINLDSPAIERGMQYLYDIKKNDLNYRGKDGSRWALRNDSFGAGLKDGLCLFYVIGPDFFTDTVETISNEWCDIANGELMFAPLPRDPQGDGNYYCWTSFDGDNGAMGIISGAANPEGAALLAACLRFKTIDPVVQQIDERQLRQVYLWNDDMMDMLAETDKIAQANRVIDPTFNLGENLDGIVRDFMGDGIIRTANDVSWAQLKESKGEQLEYYIGELNAQIAAYAAEHP